MATNNIKVVCRFRPLNATEQREGPDIVATFSDDLTTVHMRSADAGSGPEKDGFTFDRIFSMQTRQHEVFDYGIKECTPLFAVCAHVNSDVLDGYNGTVFAYGQTGSGKTFSMMGDMNSDELKGITPRITEHIFQSIVESDAHLEYLVKVSYMEIYLEKIRDLLAPQNDNLQVHEEKNKGVYVKGLSDYYVSSAREVYEIMETGGNARKVSHTNMNAESSRSHSIFLISINQRNTETGAQKTGNLYLVDLAGSEKVGKTGASGQTLEEAKKINKSLSALGMVINALTDSKVKYIPYRDSKLTRLLQESLGGNSRTTLIINCSPAAYNEVETISTLRFGIRAKTIKNSARVNAELSPLELKGLLAKAQAANTTYQKHIAALEAELAIWRSGGRVEESEWAKIGSGASAAAPAPKKEQQQPPASPASAGPTTPVATSRSLTPVHPAVEGLRSEELHFSRPQTPVGIPLEKDEREDFLRRENELSDALAEKELALATAEKLVKELREELVFLKEQEAGVNKENKVMSTQLNELRLQVERLNYDNKEGVITVDILKEQNADALAELEEVRKQIAELKTAQKDASAEDKEKRKQEKMAMMMAKFDTQGAFSEKDEQLRAILGKLDSLDSAGGLSQEDLTAVRRQLSEGQNMIRETVDRLRQSQEENEMITRRRDELETRVAALETEYEELLEKTIHDEETSNVDLAESMTDFKVKLEAQYAARREAHISEVADLKQQLEMRNNELRNVNASAESLKSVNEELKRAFAVTSAGIEGGKNLAESAQDLERTRKAINVQLAEFDGVKKSLMRDLQNRCEKVVELEIQLDEIKEQYNNVIRNSNSKAQQKKMAFLERNLEQLTLVQKQLVDQNSTLKKEAGIAERKLLARNERIQNLEALLQDADRRLSLQNQKFEAQLQAVKERLDQARAQKTASSSPLNFGRIAKPLRGGGGMGAPTSVPTPISGGGGSANPLTRIQNEDGGYWHLRQCEPTPTISTSSGAASSNIYGIGGGNGSNLKALNTGWQVWGSSSPSSKRNASMSSLVGVGVGGDMQGDASFRPNVGEPWSAGRSASGTWDDTALKKDYSSMRSPNINQFSAPRMVCRAYPGQQSSYPPSTLSYDTLNSTGTATSDLALAMRGMAVADDSNVLPPRQPAPPAMPIPPQVSNAQVRGGPTLNQQRNVYNTYPATEYGFYPTPARDSFADYPYGAYNGPDPSLYGSSAVPMSPAIYPAIPQNMHPNTLDVRPQQPPVYFDYNAATRPPSQFYFPPPQPMIYPPQSPLMSQMPAPSAPVTLAEKKLEMQYNLQQQLASRNLMFRTGASPPAYGATLDYSAQMLNAANAYGSNLSSALSFGQVMHGARRPDMQQEFVSPRSPILDEFRASGKARTWKLKDIVGYVVEFSGDQHGSRFIQTELQTASSEERQSVFDEIVPNNTLQLMQDVFGNYVIQKLFEHGTQTQKTLLANIMEKNVLHLSCNLYGCRVVQKAIESILPEQQASFVRELEPHIMKCVKDSNGNHVIQKVIERVSPERLGFVSSFVGQVSELASHPFGCRVFQRCLEHLPTSLMRPLLDELLANHVPHLMQDQFGNYVIQFILEQGRSEDKALIVAQLRGRLLFMARHKFASNVCEKALLNANPDARRALIDEIMAPPSKPDAVSPIVIMMKDQYGNYVLQKALGVAEGEQKEALINTVRPQLQNMRRQSTAYSKHLTSIERELEKISPSEPTR
ncbi:kinesin heavy chain [Favolaschia claudopus]|uniref:Pumilio homology domain family member 3 n=1 Tax=Favolaschia claudopus TaxID=2862362 RepID=A0AAW0B3F6_9AGAR